jgi:phosphomannomutase
MAAGYTCMNDLVVLQAAQGLVAYLKDTLGSDAACARGLVIGWDHRAKACLGLTSRRFAAVTALVAASAGMKVHLYKELVATPLVPWAVDSLGAAAGIMVTASHNPAADNGYKVYWGNGAQIIPPHDKGIAAAIGDNLAPWEAVAAAVAGDDLWAAACAAPHVTPLHQDMVHSYIAAVGSRLCRVPTGDAPSVPLVYTAMHGVGYPFVQAAFKAFGQPPPLPTASQVHPDAAFPTVAFPNPEEGAGALAEAMAAADAGGADLILANDPDADRLAVAERDGSAPGGWRVFTGNEIAALLADWVWKGHVAKGGKGGDDVYMLASTVSSKMLGAMGRSAGFSFLETLTGFKWMGSKTAELREGGATVLFSFEEAIGFCIGDIVKDKVRDGGQLPATQPNTSHRTPAACRTPPAHEYAAHT